MKSNSTSPGVGVSMLFGLLLTIALLSIFWMLWELTGLPYPPFEVFDRVAQLLPGSIITQGIDQMVALIGKLNLPGSTDATAKIAEKTAATSSYGIFCFLFSASFIAFSEKIYKTWIFHWGAAFGFIPGLVTCLLIHKFSYSPFVTYLYILLVFVTWGKALAWVAMKLNSYQITRLGFKPEISSTRVDRRKFIIQFGSAVAVMSVSGALIGKTFGNRGKKEYDFDERLWSEENPLPNAAAKVKAAPGTRPEYTPLVDHYRVDINTAPPVLMEDTWKLRITGLLEKPLEYSLEDIRKYKPLHQFVTLSCISNPIGGDLTGTTRWTGVSLKLFIKDLDLKPEATHLKLFAADGFYEIVSIKEISDDERLMLCYAWDGVPLTHEHGYPLRIYIPNVYGMKQPKWIEAIEVTDRWEEGYWVKRGWTKTGEMKATTVIDAVATGKVIRKEGNKPLIPIGGIAQAGARGISKVEIKIDNGAWHEAQLRTPISDTTWTIWRYDWPFKKGEHTFTVRCLDKEGNPQILEEKPPHPTGASGLMSMKKRV